MDKPIDTSRYLESYGIVGSLEKLDSPEPTETDRYLEAHGFVGIEKLNVAKDQTRTDPVKEKPASTDQAMDELLKEFGLTEVK